MLQGRPLIATKADASLFIDRAEELRQLERSARRGFNVALHGERGIGKSSLLHQLEYRERAARPVVYVDATGMNDVSELVERIQIALIGRLPMSHTLSRQFALATESIAGSPPGAVSSWLTERVRSWTEAKPTLVLVDASASAEATYALFGRLRDELWQLDHRWVVCVDTRDWPKFQRPPADAFFDITLEVNPLSDDALFQLLTARESGLPASALAQIGRESAGNPRRALELIRRALVLDQPVGQVLEVRAMRERAASHLGRPHSMLLNELENSSEPLSPSDEQLLKRMGWTRERAGQVFRDLEMANLVVSAPGQSTHGRPRKLYRPNDRFIGQ